MNKEIIITQESRSLWQNIKVAFYFSIALCTIIFYLYDDFLAEYSRNSLFPILIGFFCFMKGIRHSLTESYHFNLDEKLYKHQHLFFGLKFGSWKPLPELEYVSVFNKQGDIYEINLWYTKNKHYNIGHAFDKNEALASGKEIAKKLEIDLLDATDAQESKWIDV